MQRFKSGHQDTGFLLLELSYLANKNIGHLVKFDFRDIKKIFNVSLSHIASYSLSLPDILCQLSTPLPVDINVWKNLAMR